MDKKQNQDTKKVIFNRNTLNEFFESINNSKSKDIDDYVLEFFNYFDNESLSKMDEETGCYISHLIFQDFNHYVTKFDDTDFFESSDYVTEKDYKYIICDAIIDTAFSQKISSPFKVNKKGELYLEPLIRAKDISDNCVVMAFNFAKNIYNINIPNHKDYQGNNLLHWLTVTGRDLKRFYQFFDKRNFEAENDYGISVRTIFDLIKDINLEFHGYYYKIEETDNYFNFAVTERIKYNNKDIAKITGNETYPIGLNIALRKNDILYYLFNRDKNKINRIFKTPYPRDKDFNNYSNDVYRRIKTKNN